MQLFLEAKKQTWEPQCQASHHLLIQFGCLCFFFLCRCIGLSSRRGPVVPSRSFFLRRGNSSPTPRSSTPPSSPNPWAALSLSPTGGKQWRPSPYIATSREHPLKLEHSPRTLHWLNQSYILSMYCLIPRSSCGCMQYRWMSYECKADGLWRLRALSPMNLCPYMNSGAFIRTDLPQGHRIYVHVETSYQV